MEKTLVIMAAGMGSRFGGLKQMTPFGPNGEFLLDYSVYDAIKAGFNKVVFVIKKEIENDFKNTVGKRLEDKIDIQYAYQSISDIPSNKVIKREKPWGTGQAILACKDLVKSNFAIINSDDFYDSDAFLKASDALEKISDNNFGLIGYEAINTLTENGAVKRGVCIINDNKLEKLIESSLVKDNDKIACTSLINEEKFSINNNDLVSMNFLLFTPKVFEYLENDFKVFIDTLKNPEKDEFLIPEVINNHLEKGDITENVIRTSSKWFGVTYKEDSEKVTNNIKNMVEEGKYPDNLWGSYER